MKETQVAIIGGGPGGYVTAIKLNQMGIDTVVFEKDRLGGVCLNWGCVPTKTLVKSAELFSEIKKAKKFGIQTENATVNYKKIYAHQNRVKEQLVAGVEYLFKKREIEIINSKATTIKKVNDGYVIDSKRSTLSAKYVIVATGSKPMTLPNVKFDHEMILASRDILQLTELPEKLVVVGGGVIGCEFASIFAQLGTKVEIIEFLPQLLNQEDEEISKRLKIAFKKLRIKVHLNTGVENIQKSADCLELICSDGKTISTEKTLLSIGRQANCKIEFNNSSLVFNDNNSIKIDDKFETNLPNLFAIGDVTGKMLLAHTASKQGTEVAQIISNRIHDNHSKRNTLNYDNIPRCTYTNPEVASVGLTEKKAQQLYSKIKIGKFPFNANGKALGIDETFGFVKTIARADDDKLLGMHIIGPLASELVAESAILINSEFKVEDIEEIVFAHPTISESIAESIEDINNGAIHKL